VRKKLIVSLLLFLLIGLSCGPVFVMVRRLDRANMQLPGVNRVAVVDFQDPTNRSLGPAIGNVLVSHLATQGFYQLVERDRIQAVMKEHAFNLTGAVDPTTVKELGGLLGVEAIISGEILSYDVATTHRYEKEERKEGTGHYQEVERKNIFTGKKYKAKEEIMKTVLVDVDRYDKSGTVSINYRLIDIASGQVVVSKTHSDNFRKTYDKNTVGDNEILSRLLDNVTSAFVSDISVHYVEIRKRLLPSKADPKDMGAAYAKQGEWQRAVEIWERCAAAAPKDGALWHDIGVGYEALGKIEQAEAAYNKALGTDQANRLYIGDIAQVRTAFRGAPPSVAQGTATATDVALKLADTTPKIVKVEPTGEVYISIGSKAGVKVGDRFTAYGEKEIKNPDTGEILGIDTFDKAELLITKVMDNISLCKATKALPGNKLAVKDKVKPIK
jgi:tetratricopeptide (TPR) repeat protein